MLIDSDMFFYIWILEIEVLIVDLEKAQNTIAILERAKEALERTVNELKSRIDELTVELEATQREARAALAELQKMKHLYEKAVSVGGWLACRLMVAAASGRAKRSSRSREQEAPRRSSRGQRGARRRQPQAA